MVVDTSQGDQDYIEDCEVCCRPIQVSVGVDETSVWVSLRSENE